MTGKPALRIGLPDFMAAPELRAVMTALPRARIVGGAVRDTLLDLPVADVDLATPDPPDEVIAALRNAGLKAVPTGLAHGTVTVVSGHRGFEVTTLRRDIATDGRRATVAFAAGWREDAARRDFTINAMSMTALGDIHDYFDGLADLRAGRVRFIGDAAARIAEDYLRILRFFRFHARFGKAEPDSAAMAAISAAVSGIAQLSVERVWSEFKRILAGPAPMAAIAPMRQTGTLHAVLPEGASPARLAILLAAGPPADPILRLAALLDGDPAALAARLRFSAAERDHLLALRRPPIPQAGATDDDLRRLLADEAAEILIGRVWLAASPAELRHRLAALPRPIFPLQGRHLLAAGIDAGPDLGVILAELRAWWLAEGCRPDTAACLAELARRRAR